jgi:hypothetical protein
MPFRWRLAISVGRSRCETWQSSSSLKSINNATTPYVETKGLSLALNVSHGGGVLGQDGTTKRGGEWLLQAPRQTQGAQRSAVATAVHASVSSYVPNLSVLETR